MDTSTEVFLVLLVVAGASGALSGFVAKEKGYDYGAWFACGFFFSILALLAVAGLPDRLAAKQTELELEERRLKEEYERSRLARVEKRLQSDPMKFESNLPPLEESMPPKDKKDPN